MQAVPAVLLLQDGTVFYGKSAGKIGTTTGEIAFNTGMTGYQEIFTDPSYYGQCLVMTNAHIGNYGTKEAVIVVDASDATANQIMGLVNAQASVGFTFDYDGNGQGGRVVGTDADITIVAIGLNIAQYVSTTGVITRNKLQQYSLVAPLERNYDNPT